MRMPYHEDLAPKISRVFKNTGIKIASSNTKTNRRFFGKCKDPISQENLSGVVYEIPCSCNKSYYGQTIQKLKTRINQHKTDVKNHRQNTGLSTHYVETGHKIKGENTRIVDFEENNEKRLFLEMANIIGNKNNLNLQTDYTGGNSAYRNILCKFK